MRAFWKSLSCFERACRQELVSRRRNDDRGGNGRSRRDVLSRLRGSVASRPRRLREALAQGRWNADVESADERDSRQSGERSVVDGAFFITRGFATAHNKHANAKARAAVRQIPLQRITVPKVAERRLARRHTLQEFGRKPRQDGLIESKPAKPFAAKHDVDPGILRWALPVRGRGYVRDQSTYESVRAGAASSMRNSR